MQLCMIAFTFSVFTSILEYFCPKQDQDFKPSAAPLYPNPGTKTWVKSLPPGILHLQDDYLQGLILTGREGESRSTVQHCRANTCKGNSTEFSRSCKFRSPLIIHENLQAKTFKYNFCLKSLWLDFWKFFSTIKPIFLNKEKCYSL